MQYAPTLLDEKRRSQNVFVMLFEAQNGDQILLRCFFRLKIELKCFWGAFWGSKSSSNAFEVLFEAQNGVQILLQCFLSLKIEFKYFWDTFWGSKSNQNVFDVLFEAQNGVKVFLRSIFRSIWQIKKRPGTFFWGVRPLSKRFESYMGLKTQLATICYSSKLRCGCLERVVG